jgi:hypothetical protein
MATTTDDDDDGTTIRCHRRQVRQGNKHSALKIASESTSARGSTQPSFDFCYVTRGGDRDHPDCCAGFSVGQGVHGAQSFSAKPCELSTEIGICDYGLRMLGRLQLGLRSLSDFAYSRPRTILYTGFESNVGRSESSQEDHLLSARVKLLRVAIL